MVAAMLMVPRSTLASAVKLTEREIARLPDNRGRPPALSKRDVLDRLHAICTPCVACLTDSVSAIDRTTYQNFTDKA